MILRDFTNGKRIKIPKPNKIVLANDNLRVSGWHDRKKALEALTPTTIIGGSQSGKSTLAALMICQIAYHLRVPVVVTDYQSMTARLIAYMCWRLGMADRVVYAKLNDKRRVLSLINMRVEPWKTEYERQLNAQIAVWELFDLLWSAAGRTETDPNLMPSLIKYLTLGLRILVHRIVPAPLSDLRFIFTLSHNKCRALVNTCLDAEARHAWNDLLFLHERNNRNQLEKDIGSSQRLVYRVLDVLFLAHCGNLFTFDWAIDNAMITIFDADNLPRQISLPPLYSANQELFRTLNRRYSLRHQKTPVVHLLEEALAAKLLNPATINQYRTSFKEGWIPYTVLQDITALEPVEREAVLANVLRHLWCFSGSYEQAMIGAKDYMLARLDPNYIERVREKERVVQAGTEWYQKKTESWRFGDEAIKTEGTSLTPLSTHKTVIDVETDHRSLDSQFLLNGAKQLYLMKTGQFLARTKTHSGLIVSDKPEAWPMPFDVTKVPPDEIQRGIEEVMRISHQLPCFVEPQVQSWEPERIRVRLQPSLNGNGHVIPAGME